MVSRLLAEAFEERMGGGMMYLAFHNIGRTAHFAKELREEGLGPVAVFVILLAALFLCDLFFGVLGGIAEMLGNWFKRDA